MKVEIAKIVGTPTDLSWAQTLVQDSLYVVVEVTGQDTTAVGKNILASIGQQFQNQQKQTLATVREAVIRALQDLPDGCDINVAVLKVVEDVGYLVIRGGGVIFLKRKGVLSSILMGKKDDLVSGSGFLKDQDLVILATSKFEKLVSQNRLLENIDNATPGEITEGLSPKVHESEEGSGVACIVLSFDLDSPKIQLPQALIFLKKKSFLIAIILIIILVASIIFGARARTERQRSEGVKSAITQANAKYEEGKQLLDLNISLAYRAFFSAKEILEEEKTKVEKNSKEEKELSSFITKVEEVLLKSGRIYKVNKADLFFDLTLIREKGTGSRFAISGDELAILDSQNSSIYGLGITNKSSQIKGGNLNSPTMITSDANNIYVISLEGVHKIDKKSNKINTIIKRDDFGEIAGISAFLANIYLLDKSNSTIYKYMPIEEDKFSQRNYLASDVKPDFSNAGSLAIDGEVYVLFADGTILKYFQGAAKSFSISGLDTALSSPMVLFTNDEVKNIYVLDKGNARVAVFDKEGNYQSQYQWQGVKDVSDMVASEKVGKILLLSGSKIYSIEIRSQ